MTHTSQRILIASLLLGAATASADDKPFDATPPDKTQGPLKEAEPLLAKAAKEWASESEHAITIKRAYTLAKKWGYDRSETGAIIRRGVEVVVFTRDDTNKKCWQILGDVQQEKDENGKWSSPVFDVGMTNVVTCPSVEKLPKR